MGSPATAVHPTAVVSPDAIVGEGVRIGPYCVIGSEVELGADCILHNQVTIEGPSRIGSGNVFYPGACVGTDPQDLKFAGERTTLEVGDRNIFREFCTVHRGTGAGGGVTRIGSGGLFMATSHVAHDCILGDEVILANATLLAGHVYIEDRAILSGGVAVHHFATVGRHAFVGGLTRCPQDVPPFMILEGNPAQVRGVNVLGLRRSGMGEEEIKGLQEAYRMIWKSDRPRSEVLDDLDGRDDLPGGVRELVAFLRRSDAGRHGRALEATRSE